MSNIYITHRYMTMRSLYSFGVTVINIQNNLFFFYVKYSFYLYLLTKKAWMDEKNIQRMAVQI